MHVASMHGTNVLATVLFFCYMVLPIIIILIICVKYG